MIVIIAALVAGLAAGAWHLAAVALRAQAAVAGRSTLSLLTAPMGLVGPGLAAAGILSLAPEALWALLLGLVAARLILVRPLAALISGGAPWTP